MHCLTCGHVVDMLPFFCVEVPEDVRIRADEFIAESWQKGLLNGDYATLQRIFGTTVIPHCVHLQLTGGSSRPSRMQEPCRAQTDFVFIPIFHLGDLSGMPAASANGTGAGTCRLCAALPRTPWTSLQGRNCFGTHFVLRRMDVVARTTGWSTSSCS